MTLGRARRTNATPGTGYHTLLRRLLRAGKARNTLWQEFQEQAKTQDWDYNAVDHHDQNAWVILGLFCPKAANLQRHRRARFALEVCDFLLHTGSNPLLSAKGAMVLWWDEDLITQHLWQRLGEAQRQGRPLTTADGGNPLHTLLDAHPHVCLVEVDQSCSAHPQWVNGQQRDGQTPLQRVWFGKQAQILRQVLADSEAMVGSEAWENWLLDIADLWCATRHLLALGASLEPLDGLGRSLAQTIVAMEGEGLTLCADLAPKLAQSGYPADALSAVQSLIHATAKHHDLRQALEQATAAPRRLNSKAQRL